MNSAEDQIVQLLLVLAPLLGGSVVAFLTTRLGPVVLRSIARGVVTLVQALMVKQQISPPTAHGPAQQAFTDALTTIVSAFTNQISVVLSESVKERQSCEDRILSVETSLNELMSQVSAQESQIKVLLRERDDLQIQLNAANRKIDGLINKMRSMGIDVDAVLSEITL